MEAGGHPDLIHIGRLLRERMDRTLEAEMEAARAAARRTRTIRDLLLAAEDRRTTVFISTADGSMHAGTVDAVGADHVELSGPRIVVLDQVVMFEVRK
jgi:hypothetical protein